MRRLSTALRLLATFGMALSLLAAISVSTSAAPNPSGGSDAFWDRESIPPLFGATPSDDICVAIGCNFDNGSFDDGAQEVYFPAVGNADESTGLGAAQTSITVQNIDRDDAYLFIFVGMPEDDDGVDLDNWDVVEVTYLSAGAAKTFTAADLEVPAGEVRPVVVVGYQEVTTQETEGGLLLNLDPAYLAGVAKQAVSGESLPFTSSADTAVSGYNAISGRELGYFDQLYFPIVQTNCGPGGCWNSVLRIANMGQDDNAAVTVRFFPADDGSGSIQTGFQLQDNVDVGETWSIDLSKWVPAGWVGSAHVYTDDAVGAIVDRVKPGTDMWITNTAANANDEVAEPPIPGINAEVFPTSNAYPYVLFAPDVRTDYNGWNTGINVANTVEADTDVSIQYFGSNGNAPAAQTRRLAPHGMTYVYNPSDPSEDRCEQPTTDVPGCEFIGGAVILSSNPVAVAVDGVKYFGNDNNVGQAFSYSATANAFVNLAAALVQKGNPANGMGATSGINIMNPNATATTVQTDWLNPSGFEAENFGSSFVWVPGYATGFVYTMFHENLPNGFVGSAWVGADQPIVATTANVDYQVAGDGTAIYNLSNPCGFFRQAGECLFTGYNQPLPVNATLTKYVYVDDSILLADPDVLSTQVPVSGALVTYSGNDVNGYPVSGSGMTGADGAVTFAVPAGDYSVTIESLPDAPDGYVFSGQLSDPPISVAAGDAAILNNFLTLEFAAGTGTLTKVLTDIGDYTSLESNVFFCPGITGDLSDCADAAIVSAGYGELADDPDNVVSAEVPAGRYTICSEVEIWYDVNTDGSEDLGEVLGSITCESTFVIETLDGELLELPINVIGDQETIVFNSFDEQTTGALDVFVRDDESDSAINGAKVCAYTADGTLIECEVTEADGAASFNLPRGTYTITTAADGYEQESTTFTYSPVADAINGGLNDTGADADVVVSLDPLVFTGILDVSINIASVIGGIASVGVFVAAPGQDTNGACFGELAFTENLNFNQGIQTLTFNREVESGDYCVAVQVLGFVVSASTGTVTPNDPLGDVDVEVGVAGP